MKAYTAEQLPIVLFILGSGVLFFIIATLQAFGLIGTALAISLMLGIMTVQVLLLLDLRRQSKNDAQ